MDLARERGGGRGMSKRMFQDAPAVRKRVPLLVGLIGPSGTGKTYSALRLATGMASVDGGEVMFIDTERGRATHYAERFTFRHVPFTPPFSPSDYIAAIEYCVEQIGDKPGVIIIDSMSHCWEGDGGVLDMAESSSKRGVGAWSHPKREYRRLINTLLQTPCHLIVCARAKWALKVEPGKEPTPIGWQAVLDPKKDLVYELAVNCLLLPGANGVPTWKPDLPAEKEIAKRACWSDPMFAEVKQLDEATGAMLAKWAAGTKTRSFDEIMAELATCADAAVLGTLRTDAKIAWRSLPKADQARLKTAIDSAVTRLEATTRQREAEVSDANEDAAQ
jgi:hypothetical protein